MSPKWTAQQIPDQQGRVAVVTGANSGLGRVVARELARRGAEVVIACRNLEKGARAEGEIRAEVTGARLEVAELDLSDLASVRSFAEALRSRRDALDLLVNNAGVMAAPRRQTTDGYELQLATNHLGHFALTGLLLPTLRDRPDARVVTLSSGAHKFGRINFDDLQGERRYRRWGAYAQSKLANLMFALELDRRLKAAGSPLASLAAHPGYAATNLQLSAPPLHERLAMRVANLVVAQSAEMGALPALYAATSPDALGGTYVGPDGPGESRGHPTLVAPSGRAQDLDVAGHLWEVSERLTGVSYELPAALVT